MSQPQNQVVEPYYGPCACMGPIGTDPYCPCVMRNKGLSSSAEYTEKELNELDQALAKVFAIPRPQKEPK